MKKKKAILLSSKKAGKDHTQEILAALCEEYDAHVTVHYGVGGWEAEAVVSCGPVDDPLDEVYTEVGPSLSRVISILRVRLSLGESDEQLERKQKYENPS